jgi:hypothetical protein
LTRTDTALREAAQAVQAAEAEQARAGPQAAQDGAQPALALQRLAHGISIRLPGLIALPADSTAESSQARPGTRKVAGVFRESAQNCRLVPRNRTNLRPFRFRSDATRSAIATGCNRVTRQPTRQMLSYGELDKARRIERIAETNEAGHCDLIDRGEAVGAVLGNDHLQVVNSGSW